MPHTNVKSEWVDGNLVFKDKSGNAIVTVDGTNRKLSIPSGSAIDNAGTIAFTGTQTFDEIAGNDSSLGITGLAVTGGTGGAVVVTGGATTTSGAGGAVSLVGGAGVASDIGGAAVVTGGLGGATDAAGGAATVTAGAGQGTGAGAIAGLVGGASGAGATGNGGIARVIGGAAASTNGTGGVGSIAGGAGTGTGLGGAATVTGGLGGATNAVGGAATVTAGAGQGTAAGAVASVVGGASGGGATGNGGNVSITGGAAVSTAGSGGSVILTPGVKTSTGIAGGVFLRSSTGQVWRQQVVSTAETDAANAVAAADMIGGICVHTVSQGRALTTPTGAALLAVCPAGIAAGDSFDFTVITVGTGSDDISTLTAGDGDITFVGPVTVGGTTGHGGTGDVGTWRFRYTGANAFVGYRIA